MCQSLAREEFAVPSSPSLSDCVSRTYREMTRLSTSVPCVPRSRVVPSPSSWRRQVVDKLVVVVGPSPRYSDQDLWLPLPNVVDNKTGGELKISVNDKLQLRSVMEDGRFGKRESAVLLAVWSFPSEACRLQHVLCLSHPFEACSGSWLSSGQLLAVEQHL